MRVSVFGNRTTIGDLIVSGIFVEAIAGETIAALDICYIKASDAKAYKLGTAVSEANMAIAVMALEAVATDATGRFMLNGTIEYASWAFTVGNKIELSSTAGQIGEAAE